MWETPLHLAARLGANRSVRLLLSAKADPLLTDAGGYTLLDVASTESIQQQLIAAGSRWGPRVSDFAESALAFQDLYIYNAFLAGFDSTTDPKYNMRELIDTEWCYISSIDNPPHAVGVLSFYVALTLSSHEHLLLLESHLRLKPFGTYAGPSSGHWSIYRTELQDSSGIYYVVLQGKWNPAKPCHIKFGRRKTAFDEVAGDVGYCYIGPVGKQLEKWYGEFKQGRAYISEKRQRWKAYGDSEDPKFFSRENTQFEDSWGLGPYYRRRGQKMRYRMPPPRMDISDMCDDRESWGSDSWDSEEGSHNGDSECSGSLDAYWEELGELSSERCSEDFSEVSTGESTAHSDLGTPGTPAEVGSTTSH